MIPHMAQVFFLWIIDNKYCKIFLKLQALIDGFNDKKSIDHLYESGGLNDDTDGKPMHGTDEVRKLLMCVNTVANLFITWYSIWIENNLCNLSISGAPTLIWWVCPIPVCWPWHMKISALLAEYQLKSLDTENRPPVSTLNYRLS